MIGDHVSLHIFKIHFNSKSIFIDYVTFKEIKFPVFCSKLTESP